MTVKARLGNVVTSGKLKVMQERETRRSAGLTIIAIGKAIEVLLVVIVGTAALLFVDKLPPESLRPWVDAFAPQSQWLQSLLEKLISTDDEKLAAVGKGSLAYAALFTVEGVGLWRQKRWSEYLTAFVTGSFIPFELYGLIRELSLAKAVTIVLNAAIVAYLTRRLLLARRTAQRAKES